MKPALFPSLRGYERSWLRGDVIAGLRCGRPCPEALAYATIALAFRTTGLGPGYAGCTPDLGVRDFIWRAGDVAAAGGDVRDLLLGPSVLAG